MQVVTRKRIGKIRTSEHRIHPTADYYWRRQPNFTSLFSHSLQEKKKYLRKGEKVGDTDGKK